MKKARLLAAVMAVVMAVGIFAGCNRNKTPWQDEAKTLVAEKMDDSNVGQFVIDGVKFLVAHYPRDVRISSFGTGALAAGDPIPDVCIHGHPHVPRLEYGKEVRPAQYLVCPGSVTFPRGGFPPSVAKIVVSSGTVQSIKIESIYGETLMHVGQ